MRKKTTLSVTICCAVAAVIGAAGTDGIVTAERTPLLTEEPLGAPVVAYTLWRSVISRHPADNRPLLVTGTWISSGQAPVMVFDPTNNALDIVPVGDVQGTYGVIQGPDGWIYIGTVNEGILYRYDLAEGRLEKLGEPSPTQQWLYNLSIVGGRYVLGGTYGEGRLAGYDLQQEELVDFGRMDPPEAYVSATAPGPAGTVYCGIGSHAGLIHYDPATGKKTDILPERYQENSFVYSLYRDGPYLYASVIFDNRILLFDTRDNQLVHDFGENSSAIGSDGVVWVSTGGVTGRWDAETDDWRETRALPANTRDVTADGLAFTYLDGRFAAVDWDTGKETGAAETGEGGNGQDIFILHAGPDGNIYGSSYNLHHLFRVDPQTGQTVDLGNPIPPQSGEVYAMANHGTLMYMASYTYARLSVYDTAKPWNPNVNPKKFGELGHEQYRTPGLIVGPDKQLYIGSTPAYGKIGGALSIYDPITDKIDVHRNLIPNQSVSALISDSKRGWILGGSWNLVGGGAKPVATDAHLFAWDCATQQLAADFVPVPGMGRVWAIHLLQDGNILAPALGDWLVLADMQEERVVRKEKWPGGAITAIGEKQGAVYINSGNGFYRFDPKAWSAERIAPGGLNLAFDAHGHAYYSRGAELLRVSVK